MPRILVVDDELSIRRTLGEFLRDGGYDVVEAEDADVALRELGAGDFDVVVSDIILPRVSGVELLNRIRAVTPHAQVVMMTGEPTVETASESLRAGAADYLFKPIGKAAILRAVGHAVRIKSLDDARRALEAQNHVYREHLERLVEERTGQLRMSEARAAELARFSQGTLDALTTHVCVLAEDGTILAVNRAWNEFSLANPPVAGNVATGANYLTVCDAARGEDEAVAREAAQGLRAVGRGDLTEFSLEYPCHSPDRRRWYVLRATRFAGEGPVRIVAAHVDISARKQAEESLRVAHERLQCLVDSNVVGVAIAEATGRVAEANDNYLRLIGFARTELDRGKVDWRSITPSEWQATDEWALRRLRENGTCPPYEKEYVRRDGTRVPVLLAGTRLPGSGGQIAVFVLDLTELKQAERRIADALSFNQSIIESSPIGIVTFRATGEAVLANRAIADILGGTREAVQVQNFRRLESWKTCGLLVAAEEALSTGTEQELDVSVESMFGKHAWIACRFVPFSYGGQPHLMLMAADLTQQKLTEAKLLRAQRVESIGSLASGIAHDLNNILTPILMCAPMLSLEETPEGRAEMVQTIESSAHRAVDIVKQLLGFARGKEGQKTPVQLRHIVLDMEKLAHETFPRSIEIGSDCAPDLWPVVANPTHLHQVLLNLCVNARDAMPSGGRLKIRAENVTLDEQFVSMHHDATPGPFVLLQVADTGTGIPDSAREHIFECFFTTKGEERGTGLGLTTVLAIVRDHRGFMSFTSMPGRGTTFDIYLPAAPQSQCVGDTVSSRKPAPRGNGELVLVVDDEANICDTTRRSLERQGYSTLLAQDGIEALAQFSSHQAEVRAVVTDYMMPLMDGVTLCRTLRRLSPGTPLIVSSGGLFGQSGSEALRSFEDLGIRHVLHKPHNAEALLRALDEVLHRGGRPASQEGRS
jgi:PAS domain S-box-containing protein